MLDALTITGLPTNGKEAPSFQLALTPKFVKVEAESNGVLQRFAMAYRMFGIAGSIFLAVDLKNYNYNYTLDTLEDGRVQISSPGVQIKYKAEHLTKEEFEKLTGSDRFIYGEPIPIN
jgi:hypothetical protein